MTTTAVRRPGTRRLLAALTSGVLLAGTVAACSGAGATATAAASGAAASGAAASGAAASGTASAGTPDATGQQSPGSAPSAPDPAGSTAGVLDGSTVHAISVSYDQAAYEAMIATFVDTGEKEWISATVTIDGAVYENVGIKLKGNSSLMGVRTSDQAGQGGPLSSASADEPAGLPWRIRLDKFVEGQNHRGETDIVVRANNSATSLNEAVALELIGAAGLPTQEASPVRFSVNGGAEQLRLLVETPDDRWYTDTVGGSGILYKAEAEGDYSFRGDDPEAYVEAFEVEANTTADTEDYAPLIAFLKWVNDADAATFAAELDRWVEIDALADYLAVQDLVHNFDDIDGPGNNSYLSWSESTGRFTVISWDQNLAFNGMGEFGGPGPGPGPGPGADADAGAMTEPTGGFLPPEGVEVRPGMELPDGLQAPGDGRAGGPRGGNVLAEKFTADEAFATLVEQAKTDMIARLYADGTAQQILDSWVAVLKAGASDLVSADTIDAEAERIAGYFA